ncbi:MAG: hypothetical protein ACI3XC_05260 [Phascolarctobacterium sp.]
MNNLENALDMLLEIDNNKAHYSKDELKAKLTDCFQQLTQHSLQIVDANTEINFFSFFSHLVKTNNHCWARIYVDTKAPDAETISIVKLIGIIWGNWLYQNRKILKNDPTDHTSNNLNDILSHGEQRAVQAIFSDYEKTKWTDNNLIAAKIAGKISIAKSVVSAALRKLEMADIIETRNCGARGTRILVLDKSRLEQILEAIA